MLLAADGWTETVPGPTGVTLSANCLSAKVAVTLLAASIVTSHVRVAPEQAPDQLLNTESEPGAAVSLTTVPERYFHVVDVGDAEMVPLPSVVRNSEYCAVKVAVTLLVESIVTTQVALLPEHAPPDQPVNTKLGSAVAVRVTEVPARYCQEVDDGWAVTVPVPSVVTNSEYCAVNVAVTLLAESIVTTQVALLPAQAPDQPVNAKPGSGRAVRDTAVPALYMPVADAGWGEIVPDPTVPRLSMN